jgi:hypothetical protein
MTKGTRALLRQSQDEARECGTHFVSSFQTFHMMARKYAARDEYYARRAREWLSRRKVFVKDVKSWRVYRSGREMRARAGIDYRVRHLDAHKAQ